MNREEVQIDLVCGEKEHKIRLELRKSKSGSENEHVLLFNVYIFFQN